MILSCQNIKKTYPQQTLFDGASFLLNEHDKAALVGMNGAGKSTLLKMLVDLEPSDEGSVIMPKGITVGYLAQENDAGDDETIYEMMLSYQPELTGMERELSLLEKSMQKLQLEKAADNSLLEETIHKYTQLHDAFEQKGGYEYRSRLEGTLKGLGFSEEEFYRPMNTLSGGQKTRAHLAGLLFQSPDLIILDEPTNHLDIAATEWLETFLKNYKGCVLIVSHDRYFLDMVADKVISIEERKLVTYQGNYSDYAKKSAERLKARLSAFYKQQAEIAHEEKVIEKLKSFNREKSIKRAESREKKLDRIERIEKPEDINDRMKLSLEPDIESGKDVLSATGLSKSFGDLHLFDHTDLFIRRGEHIAIIGDNGTGKTTLLKILTGLEDADGGEIDFGVKVQVGYYDQEHQELSADKTLFEEISDAYPSLDNTKIRNTLAAFLFTGDDVYKKVSSLSGGEKGRLSLAKLMLSGANFLILDEPTNHLDITSREILQNAIRNYPGTLLYVSHDRYFVNTTATRLLHLSGGHFYPYEGNYDYFLEKRDTVEGAQAAGNVISDHTTYASSEAPVMSDVSDDKASAKDLWQQQKAEQARLKKQKQQLEECEAKIAALEEESADLDTQLSDPKNGTNLPLLQELTKKKASAEEALEELYALWDKLAE
ncbi:MAG: ABC-F family ATP-binding cassette domain-containing protein [Lachnospiraceae bacterium]|nr:ABC-F family ATP-binding cassette domain-containing protein [Lachnospiraceae bacterium]